jgi:NTP pyrophosphatase (non-canonical NTP hydrolase)
MNFKEYQNRSQETAAHKNGGDKQLNLGISTLGLVGEAGEVSELVKKHIGHGHALDLTKLEKELGDVLWYIADIATQNGISLEEVAATNLMKLKNRYPQGFSHTNSINREE